MKFVYIPIEIKNREFMAKVLLSLFLAKSGYGVIVGKSTEVEKLAYFGPKGAYIGTSIVEQHKKIFKRLKFLGHTIIALDEEGLVYYNKENFIKNRVNTETLDIIDVFLAWGSHHLDLIKLKYSKINNKVFSVGNVRMELLKKNYRVLFEEEARKIQKKYGNYILINTNFAAFNHYKGLEAYYKGLKNLIKLDEESIALTKDKIEHQKKVFNHFVKLAIALKKQRPNVNIIIRPHPSESILTWEKALKNQDIKILHEGSSISWIIGASCVIQQNCTTAIEATCLNTPVFSYIPDYDERFDSGIPNKIASNFFKEEKIIEAVTKILDNPSYYKTIRNNSNVDDISLYIENMKFDCDIFKSILNILENCNLKNSHFNYRIFTSLIYWTLEKLSILIRPEKMKMQTYFSHKYPYTNRNEWLKLINNFSQINNEDYSKLVLDKISKDSYLIYESKNN